MQQDARRDELGKVLGYAETKLTGSRVRLRRMRETDLGALAEWWLDPETLTLQAGAGMLQGDEAVKDMFRRWSENSEPGSVGLSIEATDGAELCGHVTVYGGKLPDRCGTLAIIIGPEFRSQGLGWEAVEIATGYAFSTMNLHRVELQVWSYNERAIRAYQHAGFEIEGVRRSASWHSGTYHDVTCMARIRP